MRLNEFMKRNRFEQIIRNLKLASLSPPSCADEFWEVCQIIKAWNDHMITIFIASWMSCLDESMPMLTEKWTCPR